MMRRKCFSVSRYAGAAQLSTLPDSVRLVITASIPLGLDDTLTDQEKARHQLELCCDLLIDFLKPGSELSRLDAIYELCTTHDLRRKTEILLGEDLGELVKSRGWQQMVTGERDITASANAAPRFGRVLASECPFLGCMRR